MRRTSGSARPPRGQSLVEFALLLPFLLALVLGAVEFGFVFNHHLTLEYATREGARTGAALGNGGGPLGCGAGKSPNAASVDPLIMAAVTRVLSSEGSPVDISQVSEIRIYKADASGNEVPGAANTWTYTPAAGPAVDGVNLDFSPTSVNWQACARTNATPPDSIGVSLHYTYKLQMPLVSLAGITEMSMGDRTVMALNPTEQ